MSEQQNSHKTRTALAALAATAAVGVGALTLQPDIESKIANLAEMNLAELKSTDDSVLAHALRSARENTGLEPTSGFNS